MLLFLEGLDCGGLVLLADLALTAIAVDVGELVDGNGVLLVERRSMQGLDGGYGFGGGAELDKGVSGRRISKQPWCIASAKVGLPFCDAVVVQRHEYAIFLHLAHIIQFSQQELGEFWLIFVWDFGQAVDHHKGVEALFQSDFILFLEIGEIDLLLVELVVFNR
jgi:hypothetical protein